jgi:hypothetical protein
MSISSLNDAYFTSAKTNAPITCVYPAKNWYLTRRYRSTPVFVNKLTTTTNVLTRDVMQAGLSGDFGPSPNLLDITLRQHEFIQQVRFIGVTVPAADIKVAGRFIHNEPRAQNLALVVGGSVHLVNVWGRGVQVGSRLGLQLSFVIDVAAHIGVGDSSRFALTWVIDGVKTPTSPVVVWFLPLFDCIQVTGGGIRASFVSAARWRQSTR